MSINLRGVGVALVTPFTDGGEVDYPALTSLIDHITAGGVDYMVVLGTTGEPATMTAEERHQVVRHCVAHNPRHLPIVVGIGGNNTAEVIRTMQTFDLSGVSAILSVTPYYNKPNQAGLYAHFSALLEAAPLPVILYNVPGRTGVNMTAETTLRLAHAFPGRAIAVKEASGILSQAAYILRDRPKGFFVLSGEDNLALAMVAMGGDGVISVSANVFPDTMCCMIHAALAGNTQQAAPLNLHLHEATDLLFAEGNPVGAKAALAIKGIIGNNLRLPLVPASEGLVAKLKYQIDRYGL
ncbi:4-hydroxy-tetrahydrodipicolinate synthase [uncultured Rikenella sp.]|uniref:4-hydroxy-tetrahydrodipicolinate synthase n=1 Tax=uncultured Rikenella sp. TaxID=368003 RepID=UPI002614EA42|nr:4-hydroxy-tetrahydrodipicolinate synthase [uncultured Rikenella sp.]